MKIKHYLYNAFVIESGDIKIAIDPGGLFLYYFRMTTLIPKSEWILHTYLLHMEIRTIIGIWTEWQRLQMLRLSAIGTW